VFLIGAAPDRKKINKKSKTSRWTRLRNHPRNNASVHNNRPAVGRKNLLGGGEDWREIKNEDVLKEKTIKKIIAESWNENL